MQSPSLGEAETRVDQIQVLRTIEKIDNGGAGKSKMVGSSAALQENTLRVFSIAVEGS